MALNEDHKMQSKVEPEPQDITFEINNQRDVENNDFSNNNNETNSEIRITAESESIEIANKRIALLTQQLGRSKNENTRKKQQIETLQKEVLKLQLETNRQTQEIQTLKQKMPDAPRTTEASVPMDSQRAFYCPGWLPNWRNWFDWHD